MIEKLRAAEAEYKYAMARGSGIAMAKERMKNLLFNYFDQLLQAAIENEALREEVESLDAALKEADDELKKLKKPKRAEG